MNDLKIPCIYRSQIVFYTQVDFPFNSISMRFVRCPSIFDELSVDHSGRIWEHMRLMGSMVLDAGACGLVLVLLLKLAACPGASQSLLL